MSSCPVIVREVAGQDAAQVAFAQHEDMIAAAEGVRAWASSGAPRLRRPRRGAPPVRRAHEDQAAGAASVPDDARPGGERAAVPAGGGGAARGRGERVLSEPGVAVQRVPVQEEVLGVGVRGAKRQPASEPETTRTPLALADGCPHPISSSRGKERPSVAPGPQRVKGIDLEPSGSRGMKPGERTAGARVGSTLVPTHPDSRVSNRGRLYHHPSESRDLSSSCMSGRRSSLLNQGVQGSNP